jgi:putative transposase
VRNCTRDELHLDYPLEPAERRGQPDASDFSGPRGIRCQALHVATLMKRMRIEAIYRRANTSKPAPGHTIFPYLQRRLPVTRPNQVWAMDITYIPMARGLSILRPVA